MARTGADTDAAPYSEETDAAPRRIARQPDPAEIGPDWIGGSGDTQDGMSRVAGAESVWIARCGVERLGVD